MSAGWIAPAIGTGLELVRLIADLVRSPEPTPEAIRRIRRAEELRRQTRQWIAEQKRGSK